MATEVGLEAPRYMMLGVLSAFSRQGSDRLKRAGPAVLGPLRPSAIAALANIGGQWCTVKTDPDDELYP